MADPNLPGCLELEPGAVLLRGFAADAAPALRVLAGRIAAEAPFRHLETPGGRRMSVAMTNAGSFGWVSDRRGYRYDPIDPLTFRAWPPIPEAFRSLARAAASAAGFAGYVPDCCLINRYMPGAALSLHQDRDEEDRVSPIVSVSIGLPAIFLWGGRARSDRIRRIALASGDVVVWGGPARFVFHGVMKLSAPDLLSCAEDRINLTFRRTGRSP